jgi:hydrogenase nickel incorporation protein HypB
MMCGTCGCGEGHVHIDGKHHHGAPREIALERDIMAKNNGYARANRNRFRDAGILALNLVSSPGAGKTALLVRTLEMLGGGAPCAVIEGDQQTDNDAHRIRATGVPAVQINTGKGCHLDAHMVGHAVDALNPQPESILFIENVGNLVCPAGFDLGEAHKVVVLSVTEGEDKPLKYPDMFAAADLALINKSDLLPHLDVDMDLILANARRINPLLEIIEISARTGAGMQDWLGWITSAHRTLHAATAAE